MGDSVMDIRIKPIKNNVDYREALALAEELVMLDPEPNTNEADQVAILSTLIENYEKNHFPLDIPSAVDAIKFRMDQLDLRPVDLVPYLGSASRVSEVLSGKRSLTVDMINSLSSGLGIPEKALLKKDESENEYSKNIPSAVFKQMLSRGYFDQDNKKDRPVLLERFFSTHALTPSMLYRKSKFRTNPTMNHFIFVAWANRVMEKSYLLQAGKVYSNGIIDLDYMRNIAKYSADEKNGVQNAISKLLDDGIKVVIEPALEGTKLDGVAIFEDKNHPVIGLTLRYDRLDNFWFSLLHEIAHVAKHYNLDKTFIYDDFEAKTDHLSEIELEADTLASEALVDSTKWLASAARIAPSPITAISLANELGVHPVIIAGKARYEIGKWNYLSGMIKAYKIRYYFKEIEW
jgi:HTH-type transcriptional regulator/antitoxin HigA